MGVLTVRGEYLLRSSRDKMEEARVETAIQEHSYSERHVGEHHNQISQRRTTAGSEWTRQRQAAEAGRVGSRGGRGGHRGGTRATTRQKGVEARQEENVASWDRPSSEVGSEEVHNRRERETAVDASDWTPHRSAASTAAPANRGCRGAYRGGAPAITRQTGGEAKHEGEDSDTPLVAVTRTDKTAVKASVSGNEDGHVAPIAYGQSGSEAHHHGPRSSKTDLSVSSTNTDNSTVNAFNVGNRGGRVGLHGGICTTAHQSGHDVPHEGHCSDAQAPVNRTSSIETLSNQFSSMRLTCTTDETKKESRGTIGGWHIPALRLTAQSSVTEPSGGVASAGGSVAPHAGLASISDAAEEAATGTCEGLIIVQPDDHHSERDAGRTSNALAEDSLERAPEARAEPAEGSLSSNAEVEDKPQEAFVGQQPSSRQSTIEPASEKSTSSLMPTIPRALPQTIGLSDAAIRSRASSRGAKAVATNCQNEKRWSQKLAQACREAAEQRRVEDATAQERHAELMARHGLERRVAIQKSDSAAATHLTADRESEWQTAEEPAEDSAQSNVRVAAYSDEPAEPEARNHNCPTVDAEAVEGHGELNGPPQDNEPSEKEVFFDASNEFEEHSDVDATQEHEEPMLADQQPHACGGSTADGATVSLSPSSSTVPPRSERRQGDGGIAVDDMLASHIEAAIPSVDATSNNPFFAELQAIIDRQVAAALQAIEQNVNRICTQALAHQSAHHGVPPPIAQRSDDGTNRASNTVAASIQESASDVMPEPRQEATSVTAEFEENFDKKDEDREAPDSPRQVARVSPQPRLASDDAADTEGTPMTSSFARATFGYGHRFFRSHAEVPAARVRHNTENMATVDGEPRVPSYEPLVLEPVDTTNFVFPAEPAADFDPFTMEAHTTWNNPAAHHDRAGGRRDAINHGRRHRIATPHTPRHVNFAAENRLYVYEGDSNASRTSGPQSPGDVQQAIAMSGEASHATDDNGFGARAGNDNEGTSARGGVHRVAWQRPAQEVSTGEPSDVAVLVQRTSIPGFPVSRNGTRIALAISGGRGGEATARGRGAAQPRGRGRDLPASAQSTSGTARESQDRLQRDNGSALGGGTGSDYAITRSAGFGLRFRR